ncbi:hypothetical protein [Bradyrhizobium guangxiense]|uniref:hypothetical protein n=1 Tax=Bradyrhizobium guangxiense TaxID=1325115 RepID=UPI00100936F5|nr:hypothetical protein [Bradyrhizobium guangxiense]
MATPGKTTDYTDGRRPYDWPSKFSAEARKYIRRESLTLVFGLLIAIAGTAVALAFSGSSYSIPFPALGSDASAKVDPRMFVIFFSGGVGGTTFSIKWLIHSVAKGSWHLDRQLWRLFVPIVGGVYACAVLTLLDSGMILGHVGDASRGTASAASMAFLIGYFSDGVSGLLTNIANAVFGTIREK